MAFGFVYILTNEHRNVLYIGLTNDLRKRILHHRQRLVPGFTKKYNVHRLVHFERLQNMEEARHREQQLKGVTRERKITLINATNPTWQDLFGNIN